MVEANSAQRLLFIVSEKAKIPDLIARMKTPLANEWDIVTSPE